MSMPFYISKNINFKSKNKKKIQFKNIFDISVSLSIMQILGNKMKPSSKSTALIHH